MACRAGPLLDRLERQPAVQFPRRALAPGERSHAVEIHHRLLAVNPQEMSARPNPDAAARGASGDQDFFRGAAVIETGAGAQIPHLRPKRIDTGLELAGYLPPTRPVPSQGHLSGQ